MAEDTTEAALVETNIDLSDKDERNGEDSFEKALKDLRKLRPILLDAADFAESSYLQSERKDMELHNTRDYAVSMIVTLVNRLGSIADKFNDSLASAAQDISSSEVRVASLAQRVQACWEYAGRDALNWQQLPKSSPRKPKQYPLPDGILNEGRAGALMLRETFGMVDLSHSSSLFSPSLKTMPPAQPSDPKQRFWGLSITLPSLPSSATADVPSSPSAPSTSSAGFFLESPSANPGGAILTQPLKHPAQGHSRLRGTLSSPLKGLSKDGELRASASNYASQVSLPHESFTAATPKSNENINPLQSSQSSSGRKVAGFIRGIFRRKLNNRDRGLCTP